MNRGNARARVHRAEVELDAAEQQLAVRWQPWRERIRRQRLPWLIGGGFLGGLALAMVPPKRWASLGAVLFGGSAWLARSAIGPAMLSALWSEIQQSSPCDRMPSTARPAAPSA
jgi:hypothetical protein